MKTVLERQEWLEEEGLDKERITDERELQLRAQQQHIKSLTDRLHAFEMEVEELKNNFSSSSHDLSVARDALNALQLQHSLLQQTHAKLQELQLTQHSTATETHEEIISKWNQEKLDLLFVKDKQTTELKHHYEQELAALKRKMNENAEAHRHNDAEFTAAIQVLSKTHALELEALEKQFQEKSTAVQQLQNTIDKQMHLIEEYEVSKATVDNLTKTELENLNLDILRLQSTVVNLNTEIARLIDNHRHDMELLQAKHAQAISTTQRDKEVESHEKDKTKEEIKHKMEEIIQLQQQVNTLKHELFEIKERYSVQSHQLNSDSQLYSVSQKSLEDNVKQSELTIRSLSDRIVEYKSEIHRLEQDLIVSRAFSADKATFSERQLLTYQRILHLHEVSSQQSIHYCEDTKQLNEELVKQYKQLATKTTTNSASAFLEKQQTLAKQLEKEYEENKEKYEHEIQSLKLQFSQLSPPLSPTKITSTKSVPSWDAPDEHQPTPITPAAQSANSPTTDESQYVDIQKYQRLYESYMEFKHKYRELEESTRNPSSTPSSSSFPSDARISDLSNQVSVLKEKIEGGKQLVQTLSTERKQLIDWKNKKKIEIKQLKDLIKTLEQHVEQTDISSHLTAPSSRATLSLTPTSGSLSGYALRLNTEIIIMRDLDIDIHSNQQEIQQQVQYLIQDYSVWKKEMKRYGSEGGNKDETRDTDPRRNPAHARLV